MPLLLSDIRPPLRPETEEHGPADEPLTCLLQSYHGRLLDQVPLDEAPEVFTVHAEIWQLERVDGHLQGKLLVVALTRHVGPGQGDDG